MRSRISAETSPTPRRSSVVQVLASCRSAFVGVGIVSGIVNVLMLTGSLFMMQVYDRVLGSQSVPTLVVLSLMAGAAYLFQGLLDAMRARVLMLVGERIDDELGVRVHQAVADLPLRLPRSAQEPLQPFRDLEAIRSFMAGPGPLALFDIPWIPIYLMFLYLLHPSLAAVSVAGAAVLIALTIVSEIRTKVPTRAQGEAASRRNQLADQTHRNAEVVRAMGMLPALRARWVAIHSNYLQAQRRASFSAGAIATSAKTFRMLLQSAVLGIGAYLVIKGQMSSGSIIAGTILSSRALAPIDQTIAAWKGFLAARLAHTRLQHTLALYPPERSAFRLPSPRAKLVVDGLAVAAPGSKVPIVRRAQFSLDAGQALGVIGPSASGKTTLIRGIVGLWPLMAGRVSFDGACLDQWTPEALGPSIGYLPQDAQLFDGTIAENISRFADDAEPPHVIAAAEAAGFHEHVVAFPQGYDTRIGPGGSHLSAGQRQRLGLARALYRDPFLVVLDEPNANLDAEGEAAVTKAITGVRERGGIAIVVAHRPSAIAAVDMLAAVRHGEVVAFGPRDEVLAKVTQSHVRNVVPYPGARMEPGKAAAGEND